jgi:hypothetical protein
VQKAKLRFAMLTRIEYISKRVPSISRRDKKIGKIVPEPIRADLAEIDDPTKGRADYAYNVCHEYSSAACRMVYRKLLHYPDPF